MGHCAPLSIRIVATTLLLVVWYWQSIFALEAGCSCYLLNTQMAIWAKSKQYCQESGGELVSMETEEEYQFINKTIQSENVKNNEWYIGLTRENGDWKWISGHSMTIDKWLPNIHLNKDYVKMIKDYQGLGLFDDVGGRSHHMFICEYKTAQSCASKTRVWCPSNNTLTTTTRDYITTTPFSTTTKETTPTYASKTTTQRTHSYSSTVTDEKLTTSVSSSTKNGQYTKAFTQTSTRPKAVVHASSTSEIERTTGPPQKQDDVKNPQSNTGSSTFLLVIVTAALGVVLVLSVCLLVFVFYWKRRNRDRNEKPTSEIASLPRDATEQSSNNNQGPEGGNLPDNDYVKLFPQGGGESYVTYAVIHNNLTQQNQCPTASSEPSYASIEDAKMIKKTSQKSDPNAALPAATMNVENSGNSVGDGKSNTEAVYATVDKNKKNNIKMESQDGNQWAAGQQVVYASVDKSKKSKARAEDVLYAEVGSKDNTEKQQPYQITYAELADFNSNAPAEVVKPAPYQPAEYAVIIGQKQKY